ncbi:MAG TPA: MBL fold metallo-hydrolase [Polyangiaceae bacterium]|nr:MBL fold metallo-hydrolase [Polyangiaceae bacterium]
MLLKKRLSDTVQLAVSYEDGTRYGSVLTGRCDQLIRQKLRHVAELRRERGLAHVVERSLEILTEAMRETSLGALYVRDGQLREACLYPEREAVRPASLLFFRSPSEAQEFPLSPGLTAELATWCGEWQQGASAPQAPEARQLWDALDAAGLLTDEPPLPPVEGEMVFGGHAMLRVGRTQRVLVDPFVLPRHSRYPASYQPFTYSELAPTAICITHSHPDHFDVGSLLRFGPDIPIFVPAVPRESILAVDMAYRLRELGFRDVRPLPWFSEADLGSARISSLPFYGEQPTSGESLHPEVRNMGNLYVIECEGRRCAVTADAGWDRDGSTADLALLSRRKQGALDVLFGGYRSWAMYPIQYLFCSVTSYLLFVPRDQWHVRQRIMNGLEELFDTAERWQARHVVPYADGGAPWYWERGLGPRLDGAEAATSGRGRPNRHFDPDPEDAIALQGMRSTAADGSPIASPTRVQLMRPGQALDFSATPLRQFDTPGHVWPYGSEARP